MTRSRSARSFSGLLRGRGAPWIPALVLLLPICARADRVEYNDGRVVHGIIVSSTESSVTIQNGSAEFRIPRDVIRKILEGNEADRYLVEAKSELSAKRAARGIASLGRAARESVAPESLAAVMLFHAAEITGAVGKLDADGRQALEEALAGIASAQLPRQGDLLLARLRWHLALGDSTQAREVLAELQASQPRTLDPCRSELAGLIESRVDAALRGERFSEAIDLLELLRRIDRERAGGKRVELVLLWARRERDRGRYREALEIYSHQLMDESPQIAADRIFTTLGEAEQELRSKGQLAQAADLYELYGMKPAPARAGDRLATLWHEIGWDYLRNGEIEAARRTFARIDGIRPGGAARDLAYCDYNEKKAALSREDFIGHYTLGEWCLKRGLLDEAREGFLSATGSGILRADAYQQIDRIDHTQAEAELNRLLDLYEGGQYYAVMDGLLKLRQRPLAPGFTQQAEKLQTLTHDAIEVSAAARPQQAEVLWQQAERAFFTGDRNEAFRLLATVTERYAGTPAAARAEKFYRLVRPQIDLDRIETGTARFPRESEGATPRGEGSPIAEEIRRLRAGASAR